MAFSISIVVPFLNMTKQFAGAIGQVSNQVNMVIMGLAGAHRIFALLDEQPETDEGYVTLVNARENADGTIEECERAHRRLGLEASPPRRHASPTPGCRATCASTTSTSAIRRKRRCCTTSPSTPSRARRWPLSAPPARARPPSPTSSTASTTSTTARSATTASTSTRSKRRTCATRLGIVLQDTNLFTGTVMENIRYGNLDATRRRVHRRRQAGRRGRLHPPPARGLQHHAAPATARTSARASGSCWPSPAPPWPTRR